MWLELGKERPGGVPQNNPRIWVNTDHMVRVEFTQEGPKFTAIVISTKPGGSDRSVFAGDDAERLRLALNIERTWAPQLDYEQPTPEELAELQASAAMKNHEKKTEAMNGPTKKRRAN